MHLKRKERLTKLRHVRIQRPPLYAIEGGHDFYPLQPGRFLLLLIRVAMPPCLCRCIECTLFHVYTALSARLLRSPRAFSGPTCALLLFTLFGCSAFGQEKEDVPWDTDIPESEPFDATMGTWSPDGKRIAFVHTALDQTGQGPLDALWTFDFETRERREIVHGRIIYPEWSQNGEWLVFQTKSDPQYLWKIQSDGQGATPLTGPGSPNPTLRYTILGKWHPSSDSILFTIGAGDPRGVSVMAADGTGARIVIPYGMHGSWFPDGKRLAYMAWDPALPVYNQQQIFVANADGSNPRRITNSSAGKAVQPSVSPDGEQIVFVDWDERDKDGDELFLVSPDGSNLRQVTGGQGLIENPKWSPDGRCILFARWIPNISRRLYLLDVETLEVEPLFPAKHK